MKRSDELRLYVFGTSEIDAVPISPPLTQVPFLTPQYRLPSSIASLIASLESTNNVKINVLKEAKESGENVIIKGLREDVEKVTESIKEIGEREDAKAEERRNEREAQRAASAATKEKREDDAHIPDEDNTPTPKKSEYDAVPVGIQGEDVLVAKNEARTCVAY